MTRQVTIAVVSDIHAAIPSADGNNSSYASTAPNKDATEKDAILSLQKLIETEGISTDFLVCCGDMADRANPTAMNYVWTKFHQIAEHLKARPIATVGNHDIDSRFTDSDHDARGMLRNLSPTYPLGDDAKNYEFWSRNFVVVITEHVRLVILNSCAYHGFNPDPKAPEHEHGRISNYTLSDLKSAIEADKNRNLVNLLICHHHPHKHQDIESEDYSSMQGGEKLIDLLKDLHLGPWMVIHGHKHHPRLIHGAGGALAPLIFGAGSLSAKIHADLQGKSRNQFYVLKFDLDSADELDLQVAGEVRAWDFQLGQGWVPAKTGSGLPFRSGFGYAISQPKKEARQIAATVGSLGGVCSWQDLLASYPYFQYVLPSDLESLAQELKSSHSVGVVYDEHGTPFHFANGS